MNIQALAVAMLTLLAGQSLSGEAAQARPLSKYPAEISKDCRQGKAKVYDECSDQGLIANRALDEANKTGKSVLVVFGAEWCIWCHVFDKYVSGQSEKYTYTLEGKVIELRERANPNAREQAAALNAYVAENFVVAHIESQHSPNGKKVLGDTGAATHYPQAIPFVFVLRSDGKYAAHLPSPKELPGLEIRSDGGNEYRGYDRTILLTQLKRLRETARR